MKITIATGPCFPVPPLLGGACARLWQGLAEQFAAQGHAVTIFCRAYPGQPSTETLNGVRYLRFGGFSQSTSIGRDLVLDLAYAMRAVWRLPDADILVINDFFLPVLAGLCSRRAGIIVINSARYPKGQYWIYGATRRFAACSRVIRDAIAAENPSAGARTRVLPNPVDIDLLRPPERRLTNSVGQTILYVGRLHPEKGVHLLVEAFSHLCSRHPAARLRLVGPHRAEQGGGGDAYLAQLRSLASSLPVDFSGPIFDFRQLASAYHAADIFCYPSLAERGEALPVAPLEAMAAGLVPVVSDLACFRDYLVSGVSGIVFDHREPGPVSRLASALDGLLHDPARQLALGQAAQLAAQPFSYPAVARRFLDDFADLLRDAGRNPDVKP